MAASTSAFEGMCRLKSNALWAQMVTIDDRKDIFMIPVFPSYITLSTDRLTRKMHLIHDNSSHMRRKTFTKQY